MSSNGAHPWRWAATSPPHRWRPRSRRSLRSGQPRRRARQRRGPSRRRRKRRPRPSSRPIRYPQRAPARTLPPAPVVTATAGRATRTRPEDRTASGRTAHRTRRNPGTGGRAFPRAYDPCAAQAATRAKTCSAASPAARPQARGAQDLRAPARARRSRHRNGRRRLFHLSHLGGESVRHGVVATVRHGDGPAARRHLHVTAWRAGTKPGLIGAIS